MDSELPEDSLRRSFSPRYLFSSQFEWVYMIWDDLDLHSMLMGPAHEHGMLMVPTHEHDMRMGPAHEHDMLMGPAHELGMFEGRIPKENHIVIIFVSSVILAKNQWISIRIQNGCGHMGQGAWL